MIASPSQGIILILTCILDVFRVVRESPKSFNRMLGKNNYLFMVNKYVQLIYPELFSGLQPTPLETHKSRDDSPSARVLQGKWK